MSYKFIKIFRYGGDHVGRKRKKKLGKERINRQRL